MNERREISFLLTVEDHVAFNRVLHRRLPFGQRNLSKLMLGGSILVTIFMTVKLASEPVVDRTILPLSIGGSVLFIAFVGGVVWWMHPSQFPRRVRALLARPQNQHMIGDKFTSIGPEGITTGSQDTHSLIRWDMIEDIVVTDDHAFFFFAQRAAMILPRRPFASEDDFEDFMNLARRYYEGIESESPRQPESISAQPTRDETFTSGARREDEPPTVLRVHDEQGGACRNLSFVLTVEDHIAFHNLLHQRLPFWRRYLALLMVGVLIPAVGIMLFTTERNPRVPLERILLIRGTVFGTLLVVLGGVSVFMMRRQAAIRARKVRTMLAHPQNQKFVSEVTITITPEEIISQSMTGTSSLRWERIHEIVVTADHAFFFHAERAAITVPKRPLQAEEFEEFVDLARQYHEDRLSREETE